MTVARAALLPSVDALTAGLVDYAGLFPPAGLDMRSAVHNYAAYRRGGSARLLGRFIVPASRLSEFAAAAGPLWPHRQHDEAWPISALAGADLAPALEQVDAFNRAHAPHAAVDNIEMTADAVDAIRRATAIAPSSIVLYVEIPMAQDPAPLLAAIGEGSARAKIRTGGLVATAIPPSSTVARFMLAAARAHVPFKATAGLHHAIRGTQHLTYETGSPSAVMHGFLNVFLAAALACAGGSEAQVVATLDEVSPHAFRFDADSVHWHGVSLGVDALRNARTKCAVAFGSCSFHEPVEELRVLGLL